MGDIDAMHKEIKSLNGELFELRSKVLETWLNEESFEKNKKKQQISTQGYQIS